MDFTDAERALLLAGLFELTVARFENTEFVERVTALAIRLGGDPDEDNYFQSDTSWWEPEDPSTR